MEFEWDEAKDAANLAKNGIGLAEASRMDWADGTTLPDERLAYGEHRFVRYAFIGDRLYACAFTDRGKSRRIISLRKANKREIITYG